MYLNPGLVWHSTHLCLCSQLGWPLHEGDDFHPRENIEKMARGEPLTDQVTKSLTSLLLGYHHASDYSTQCLNNSTFT